MKRENYYINFRQNEGAVSKTLTQLLRFIYYYCPLNSSIINHSADGNDE